MALLRMLANQSRQGALSALSDLGEVMRGSHPDGLQPIPPPSVWGHLSPFRSHRPTYLSGLLEPGVSPGFSLKEYIQQLPQGPNPAFMPPTPPSVPNSALQLIPSFAWSDLSPLRPHRIGEFLLGNRGLSRGLGRGLNIGDFWRSK